MVYISKDPIPNCSSLEDDLVMSCTSSVSKLSDVLDVLSERPEETYLSNNVGAVYSLDMERQKQVFTDAFHYCIVLLRQSNRLASHKSEVLTLEATLMGHEMFERLININVQMDVETEESFAYSEQLQDIVKREPESDNEETTTYNELDLLTTIKQEKEDTAPLATPVKSPENKELSPNLRTRSSRRSRPMVVEIPRETMQDFLRQSKSLSPEIPASNIDDKQLPPSPVSLSGSDFSTDNALVQKIGRFVPLETKERVVNLARMNPTWSLKTLKKESRVPHLHSAKQLKIWEKQVDAGGSNYDKFHTINTLTFERFIASRAKSQPVSREMIRYWAIQAARDVYGPKFKFKATSHWVMTFKRCYNLHWSGSNGYYQKNEKKAIQAARLAEKKKKKQKKNKKT